MSRAPAPKTFSTIIRRKVRTKAEVRAALVSGRSPRATRTNGDRVQCFPPVADADARILILGSMPGPDSLRMKQYYAHRANRFWLICGELFDAGPLLPYEERLARLKHHQVALWDVIHRCSRRGALDTAIVESSIIANDFASFYAGHPAIRRVYFNGSKAESAYRRYVLPKLPANFGNLIYERLPSTSPANASVRPAEKLKAWRRLLD